MAGEFGPFFSGPVPVCYPRGTPEIAAQALLLLGHGREAHVEFRTAVKNMRLTRCLCLAHCLVLPSVKTWPSCDEAAHNSAQRLLAKPKTQCEFRVV